MQTLTHVATWIEGIATRAIAFVLRGVTAFLAFALRRGRHRAWRRDQPGEGKPPETSGP